jgi:hypothetical protein
MMMASSYFQRQDHQGRVPKALILGVWALTILCGSTANAQPVAPPPTGSTSAAGSAQNPGANSVTQAAVQAGALSCASRVEQMTRFAGFGAGTGATLMIPAQPVDQRLFAVQMEVAAGASSNTLVDISFAPQQSNGCGATYEAISYWKQSCDSLATGAFAQLKRLKPLQKDVLLLDGGPALRVFLIQAGTGCVSVKKEIVL